MTVDLFADDAVLLDAVWDHLGELAAEGGLEALEPRQRAVLLALRVGALLDEGDVGHLLEHEDVFLEQTRDGLARLGLERQAEALAALIEHVSDANGALPADVEERMAALVRWRARIADEFSGERGGVGGTDSDERGVFEPEDVEAAFERGPFATALADFVRSDPAAVGGADLAPAAFAIEEPEPPSRTDSVEDVAAWIESLGGGVLRVTADRPQGRAKASGAGRRVVGGKKRSVTGRQSVLRAVRLPALRRDLDTLIAHLAGNESAVAGLETVELQGAWHLSAAALRTLAEGLPALRELDLRAARVDDRSLACLAAARGLERLELGGLTDVTDEGLRSLAGLHLRRVRALESGIGGDALAEFPRLIDFSLGGRAVRTAIDPALRFLCGLDELDEASLFSLTVDRRGVRTLSERHRLQALALIDTGLAERDLEPLADLPALESLFLQGVEITKAGATILARCQSLRRLEIPAEDIAPKARRVLAEARTDLDLVCGDASP